MDDAKIVGILARARSLRESERAAFLRIACGDDDRLQREILELLAHETAPTIDAGITTAAGLAPSIGVHTTEDDAFDGYKVISQIGEGGFGIVYLAEQIAPLRRRVALKILKPGMDSRAVLARFEAERQTLALLDHPSIARIFDAGITRTGRPYFAMEYVAGVPLTTYCDRHRLTILQRLEIFACVCDAISHAHTRGIIHRDLKPNNILVTVTDKAEAVPKVIDFGIAKALQRSTGESTLITEAGMFLGTPEYMSPEQAELDSLDIDVRSDIYSLGVVLYELLTGALPFDAATLRAGAIREIRRIIREVDPPKPSTRFAEPSEASRTRAEFRRSRAEDLARTLRKELEWIPLKALRKDRTERYESARDFANDVRNYLTGKPLKAGPESVLYRSRKFVQRNRTSVAAAALIMVSVASGIGATTRALVLRNAEYERAKESGAAMNAVLTALFDQNSGGTSNLEPALEKAAALVQPNAQWRDLDAAADLATACASGFRTIGRAKDALICAQTALAWRRQLFGDKHFATLESRQNVAAYAALAGDATLAESMLIALIPDYEQAIGSRDLKTLNTRATLVSVLFTLDKLDDANREIETLTIAAREAGSIADPVVRNAAMCRALILVKRGELENAVKIAAALANSDFCAKDPASREAINIRSLYGGLLVEAGDHTLAIEVLRPTLADARAAFGDLDPAVFDCGINVISALHRAHRDPESAELAADLLRRWKRARGASAEESQAFGKALRIAVGDHPLSEEQRRLLEDFR